MDDGANTITRIHVNLNLGKIAWGYFNPDAVSGGQYVLHTINDQEFMEIVGYGNISDDDALEIEERLGIESQACLVDITDEDFPIAEMAYYGYKDFIEFTAKNLEQIRNLIMNER